MKKAVAMIMVVAMILSLAGCGDKKVTPGGNETETSVSKTVEEKTEDSKTETKEEKKSEDEHEYHYIVENLGLHGVQEVYKHSEDLTDWGSYASFVGKDCRIYIKFPSLVPTGSNHDAYQEDNSVVFVDILYGDEILADVSDVSSIFKVATDKKNKEVYSSALYSINMYWLKSSIICTDMNFTIDTSETVTLNQYECCKNTGIHTYTDSNGETHSFKYVAYSTFTISGEPFYWMIVDKTDDQSISEDTIEQNAERMGYTICEEPRR